ncbi:MAG: glutathione transferase GstA [Burkholderiales bacterium]|nr:MAG: glutathione transferase GstA [Burkholderiales bacterium]
MKLYFSPGACSQAPHIVLREINANFELVGVDTGKHTFANGQDFYAVNAKGQVPVLELDSGERLTEGPIISQYLADRANATSLLPGSGIARYRVLEWANYITSELHKSYTPLFNPELDAAAKAVLRKNLRKKYEWVDAQLAGKNHLTGDVFTIADAYLFVVTNWRRYVDLDLSDLLNLNALLDRVAVRPAVEAALRAEKQSH